MGALWLGLLLAVTPVARADLLAVGTEPLGHGDDRVGKRLEARLREATGPLLACRVAPEGGPEPFRFLGMIAIFRTDGSIRTVKVTESTGSDAVDACVVAIVAAQSVDPPPMFADRMNVGVTWIAPSPPEAPPAPAP